MAEQKSQAAAGAAAAGANKGARKKVKKHVTDGIARVRLAAACASCPAGIPMILAGLEQALKEHLPAVEFVEPVG